MQTPALLKDNLMEIWKRIPNSIYEASSEGRVRRSEDGKIYVLCEDDKGYLLVGLRFVDRRITFKVHQLVCLAFNGVKPMEATLCRHLDGDKKNNRPSNLRWGTAKENATDTIVHGRQIIGFDHPNLYISREEAVEIRSLYKDHMKDRKKAQNGFITSLVDRYPHLTYKCVYKAATGFYDEMV